jgi:signal peptidase II
VNKKNILLLSLSLLIILIDQYSKHLIDSRFNLGEIYPVVDGLFNLTYVRNSGIAFGMGQGYPDWIRILFFKIIPIVAVLAFSYIMIKKDENNLIKVSYALIIGGAIGNIIDRVRLDYVVDMFDFYYERSHFATFNVADAAISVAAGLIIIDFFMNSFKKKNSGEAKV